MRPNRRWIAPAALTALAAATTAAALAEASAGPSTRSRTPDAVTAASTTAAGPSHGAAAAGRAGVSSAVGTTTTAALAAAGTGNVQIAATTLGTDLKVTLRAYRIGKYDARVDVAALRYSRGAWRPAWHERVPGPWFYYPLTGKNGVCSLRVTNRPGAAATVNVSLLVSPSVGCSPVRHFTIR